jgi:acyl-CoA synthetase (AMP-forming)/AMP-acid ligase II
MSNLCHLKVLGTVGPPVKHTEIKVFDIETGDVLPDGSKGIVKIKGPQVMKGYYKVLFPCFTDKNQLPNINQIDTNLLGQSNTSFRHLGRNELIISFIKINWLFVEQPNI